MLDRDWYAEQVAAAPDVPVLGDDPVRHYLQHGAGASLSPHPLFLASWYCRQTDEVLSVGSGSRSDAWPLLHFLDVGARRGLSPHPLIDTAVYLADHPRAAEVPLGPLGHLMTHEGAAVTEVAVTGSTTGHTPATRTAHEAVEIGRRTARILRASRGLGHLRRERTSFDHVRASTLATELRSERLPDDPPLVSVILSISDSAETTGAAVDSVLAQSWKNWELVVVDDGRSEGSVALLNRHTDPRIVQVRADRATGVAAARNVGLAAASGSHVAYLTSDAAWEPDFLELMVRFMHRDGHRAAYAVSALVETGGRHRTRFRGMPYSREALRERNYIDCDSLVHERALVEAVGTFDESLPNAFDWDFLLRLADRVDLGHLPVVGARYDGWAAGSAGMRTDGPLDHRHRVQQRSLLDSSVLPESAGARIAGRTSIVVAAPTDAVLTLDTVRRVRSSTVDVDVDVIVVADGRMPEPEHVCLLLGLDRLAEVDVHRVGQIATLEVLRNLGAARASGDVLVFLPAGAWCEPGWLPPLRQALDDHAAVQPVVLHRDGTVWSAGVYVGPRGRARMLYRGLPGDAPEVRGVRGVDAASAAALAVRAEVFADVEGFDPLGTDALSSGELSLRAATATGRPVAAVGDSRVALLTPPYADLPAWARRRHRSGDVLVDDAMGARTSGLVERLAADGTRLLSRGTGATDDPDGTPLVVHDRLERPVRFSIKIGAADVPDRETWGDWHFAVALADSLERLGHHAVVDCVDAWYRPSAHLDDVTLALRGLSYVDPSPDHVNLLWVISHSDRVTTPELLGYDAVFGASDRWCRQVSRRLPRPARTLLQCTDQRRFHPVPVDPARAHDVLAVANARNAGVRPSVAAVLEAGIVPDVYGTRWEGVLPPGAWKGLYVPNEELVSHYVSSTVVLNDHHEDMRVAGLLSNRLFDLAACEARVLSDHLPEVAEVFGDVVATWTDPSQVAALVKRHRHETPQAAEERRALGAHVREHHTFDARAAELAATALELRRARDGR